MTPTPMPAPAAPQPAMQPASWWQRWPVWSLGLFAALCFINPARTGPDASFWQQAGCVLGAALWLACWRAPQPPVAPRLVLGALAVLPGFAALTVLQLALGLAQHPLSVLLLIAIALLALLLGLYAQAGLAGSDGAARREQWLAAWVWGLIVALAINAAATLGNRLGFETIWLQWLHSLPSWRALGTIGQANQVGVFCILVLAGLWWRLQRRQRLDALSVAAWLLAVTLAAFSYSRAALVVGAVVALLQAASLWQTARPWQALRTGGASRRQWLWWALGWGALAAAHFVAMAQMPTESVAGRAAAASHRIALFSDAWQLFARHPLLGVGWPNYGGSRYLELSGPLAEPTANHAHNLVAQVAAEWGLAGLALLVWLAWTLWRSASAGWRASAADAAARRDWTLVWSGIAAIGVYSQFEFPLWYLFFILPLAWLLGVAHSLGAAPGSVGAARILRTPRWLLVPLLLAGLALVVADYRRLETMSRQLRDKPASAPISAVLPLPQAMAVLQASSFAMYAHVYAMRALGLEPIMVKDKLEVARAALLMMPGPERLAYYLVMLHWDGRTQEARALLAQVDARSPLAAQQARRLLGELPRDAGGWAAQPASSGAVASMAAPASITPATAASAAPLRR